MSKLVGLVAVCALVSACKAKSTTNESKGTTTGSAVASAGSGSAVAAGSGSGSAAPVAAPKPAKPAPTKEQVAEFRKHMKAGWAAQKKHEWADATTEFEAAAKILEGDQRALSELGWSAMNAGDFAKARKADDEAVKVAINPKVKAASLYNLGMVQLKTGDKDGALRSFLASLELRPHNKIVEGEVAKLGATPETETPACAAGTPACDCVRITSTGSLDPEGAESCKPNDDIKPPVPGWHVYRLEIFGGTEDWLVDDKNQIVTQIGEDTDRMRSTSSITLAKAELKTVGGHQVVWLETLDKGTSDYMDESSFNSGENEMTSVTVCIVGDDKTPTKCERDLPKHYKTTSDYWPIDAEGNQTGKGTHDEKEVETDIALADDGTLTVKLVKGAGDDWLQSSLGPHKLW